MSKISPLVQDTIEALVVMGGNIKRYKRKLIACQGEMEKLINEMERIERFVSKRESELKEMIEGEWKKND